MQGFDKSGAERRPSLKKRRSCSTEGIDEKAVQEEETKQREETAAELVFTLLDSDADGRVTAQDLTWVCTQLGLDTSDVIINDMLTLILMAPMRRGELQTDESRARGSSGGSSGDSMPSQTDVVEGADLEVFRVAYAVFSTLEAEATSRLGSLCQREGSNSYDVSGAIPVSQPGSAAEGTRSRPQPEMGSRGSCRMGRSISRSIFRNSEQHLGETTATVRKGSSRILTSGTTMARVTQRSRSAAERQLRQLFSKKCISKLMHYREEVSFGIMWRVATANFFALAFAPLTLLMLVLRVVRPEWLDEVVKSRNLSRNRKVAPANVGLALEGSRKTSTSACGCSQHLSLACATPAEAPPQQQRQPQCSTQQTDEAQELPRYRLNPRRYALLVVGWLCCSLVWPSLLVLPWIAEQLRRDRDERTAAGTLAKGEFELATHEAWLPLLWCAITCLLLTILTSAKSNGESMRRKFEALRNDRIHVVSGTYQTAQEVVVVMESQLNSSVCFEAGVRVVIPLLFSSSYLLISIFYRVLNEQDFCPTQRPALWCVVIWGDAVSWVMMMCIIYAVLAVAYLDILKAYRSIENLTCLISLNRAWGRGLPYLNCQHYENAVAWFRVSEHVTMFVKASMQSWGPVLRIFLLLLGASLLTTLVSVFFSDKLTSRLTLFYLHTNSFTAFSAIFVANILRQMVQSLTLIESQLATFGQLKLELTQQMWSTLDPSHTSEALVQRTAKQLQLTMTLLDHISSMVAHRGTPFRLFGLQVSGNMLKTLVSLASAAIVTVLVRVVASSAA